MGMGKGGPHLAAFGGGTGQLAGKAPATSIGIAQHSPNNSYSDTISQADHALLEAKRGGRNQLHTATAG